MNKYTCAVCYEVYEFVENEKWNDLKATQEFLEVHPEYANTNEVLEIVCDDCYQQYRAWLDTLSEDEKKKMRETYE